MTTVVIDASALVALLVGGPASIEAVTTHIADAHLCAPAILHFETANAIRRLEMAGRVAPTLAALAFDDLMSLPIDAWPFEAVADRVWQLRSHASAYDAAYVAMAEYLEVPLVTADARLAKAHGIRCSTLLVTAD